MARPLDIIDPKKDLDEVEEHQDEGQDKKENDRQREGDRGIEIEESSGSGTFYLVLGIVAIVLAAGFAVYILYKDQWTGKDKKASVSVTATASAGESAVASSTASASASTTTLPVTEPTQTSSSATSYSSFSVKIANGNGITGEAARIKGILEGKGFKVTATGNASKNYDSTIIYYNSGKSDLATALKSAIAGDYPATTEESSAIAGNYDAVVALGKK